MVNLEKLLESTEDINSQLARYGVKFGIYKNGTFKEQLFPYDPIPRMIGKEEFAYLEKRSDPLLLQSGFLYCQFFSGWRF